MGIIKAYEIKEITELSALKEKNERWIELALPEVEKLLITQANLGKYYLHIGQSNVKWMSVPEFRSELKEVLESFDYRVEQEQGNYMKVMWS